MHHYKIKPEIREKIIKFQAQGFGAVDIKRKLGSTKLKKMQIAGVMAHNSRGTYEVVPIMNYISKNHLKRVV